MHKIKNEIEHTIFGLAVEYVDHSCHDNRSNFLFNHVIVIIDKDLDLNKDQKESNSLFKCYFFISV